MAVYVDDMRARFGQLVLSHMVADTPRELRAMARRIGLRLRWLQHAGTTREHFDVCQTKRALALRYGARAVTRRELVRMVRAREARLAEAAALARGEGGAIGQ